MEDVKVDTQELRGGPIEWSKTTIPHPPVLPRLSLGPAKSAVTITKDWVAYDVK